MNKLLQVRIRVQVALATALLLVVRLGGDEMVFVCHVGQSGKAKIAMLAKRILSEIQMPFVTGGNNVSINMSIGITLYPAHGKSVNDLLDQADIALYTAKAQGKSCYVLYSVEIS